MLKKLRFQWIFAALALLPACKKDPKQPADATGYAPHYINPALLFPSIFGMPDLPKNNPLTEEGVFLGRMLFYDPVLSFDSSISCSSCHDQKHAFADPRKFSTGVFGLKTGRNAPPLMNMAYSRVFFWDARQKTLQEQALEPIQAHNEMAMTLPLLEKKLKQIARYKLWFKKAFNSEPDVFNTAKALEQFQLTMVSAGSRFNQFFPKNWDVLTPDERKGAILFNNTVDFVGGVATGADCFHCHGGQLTQQNNPNQGGISSNGLDSVLTDKGFGGISGGPLDMGTFKTPSLLNIALTAPYMHDGRFATLDEVIDHYSDHMLYNAPNLHPSIKVHAPEQIRLSPAQKAQLKAFLLSMTDTAFINDPAFGNPFR
ncbi:MAG: cytochrome-c peroxidase [Bacteroidetes bacterium]|nr:cytochrome-c peroxidase [Bacteroidota bacterium]